MNDLPPREVSLVIPLLNEAESLPTLKEKIDAVDGTEGVAIRQVIFVDDGSTDNSWAVIKQLRAADERVVALRHRRNFGKATGLSNGFAVATSPYVVTMDADLQDDPAEIPALIAVLESGYDLVSGWKKTRHDPLEKRLPSKLFNFATQQVSGLKLHDFNCGLKAYRREVVQDLPLYGELHRYIPILAHENGFRVAEKAVQHHPREFGVSKYGWKRYFKGLLDLMTVATITRYLQRPGHLFGGGGLLMGSLGFFILAYLSAEKLILDTGIGGRPLFFLGILLMLLGAQLVSIGLIGELIYRSYGRQQMPATVSQRLGI